MKSIWSSEEELERLAQRFVGVNQARFAREHGVPGGASMVNQHIHGRRPLSLEAAAAYARGFGVPLEEISPRLAIVAKNAASTVIATGRPVRVLHDEEDPGDEYVRIPEHEVSFSAGPGRTALINELADSTPATYRLDWFQRMGINPNAAKRFKVHGDSMAPLLCDGDSVLVNLQEVNIINGKVYAIRYGDELRIKRVYRRLDGTLTLRSDNPDHLPRDEEIPPEVAIEQIGIIGRVRDKAGSGGL
jgi:phage repressor protein C with HTH and peptisase S24 domain